MIILNSFFGVPAKQLFVKYNSVHMTMELFIVCDYILFIVYGIYHYYYYIITFIYIKFSLYIKCSL